MIIIYNYDTECNSNNRNGNYDILGWKNLKAQNH